MQQRQLYQKMAYAKRPSATLRICTAEMKILGKKPM